MMIRDMFVDDINRKINGVIKEWGRCNGDIRTIM